ncbi:MAG TPA: PilZ domain-containing protein [Candidatus Xenobia bacterium]|nr:PilZ domain-containing protein [Candidatus Xenobia bacterium]
MAEELKPREGVSAQTQGANKRAAPRVPILTQVEAQSTRRSVLGQGKNISVGGMLVETPDTFPIHTSVVVRFVLPKDRYRIEAAGRVVWEDEGRFMGIAFTGLTDAHEKKIAEYAAEAQEEPSPLIPAPVQGTELNRRSGRVLRRVAVILSWQDADGHPQVEATETQLLSKHGALVLVSSDLIKGQLIWVTEADSNRKSQARVVFAMASQTPGKRAVAFELLGIEDFWGIEFPPAHPPSPISRRRSGRVEHDYDVVMVWSDEWNQVQETPGRTRILSDHGAEVITSVALPVGYRVRLKVPKLQREANAQIIWARAGDQPGRVELGIELVGVEGFWDVEIPPEPGVSKP